MISPRVAIVDVDPDAFAHINAVLSRRDRSTTSSKTLVLDGPPAEGGAEALRREHGVDELVVLDRSGLDDLSAQLAAAARETDDQGELLVRCRQIYVNHPAVTLVPAPGDPSAAWEPVRRLLGSIEDGQWVSVVAGEWQVAAEVLGGRIVRITSEPPQNAVFALSIQGEVDDLDAVLSAPSPLGELWDRASKGHLAVDVREGVQWSR